LVAPRHVWREKMLKAFFKMSRSISTCRNRARNCETSRSVAPSRDGARHLKGFHCGLPAMEARKKSLEHFLPPDVTRRYQVVETTTATGYSVAEVCRAVRVSRSGFYAWQQRLASGELPAAVELTAKVEAVSWRHSRRYGSRRIRAELKAEGVAIGRRRVQRVMRERKLRAIQPKSYVPRTTDSRHAQRASPNLLHAAQMPQAPKRVLVGDITYLPLGTGSWAYLATWQDLYSRIIAGWAVAETMTEALIITALKKAIARRPLASGCIVHSDRGGQYVGSEFRRLLASHDLCQSMSRKAEMYDNAFAESLFSRYKAEVLEGGVFRDVVEARMETFNYIEGYYNRVRRHSSLGYLSPAGYEQAFYEKAKQSTINDNEPSMMKGQLN